MLTESENYLKNEEDNTDYHIPGYVPIEYCDSDLEDMPSVEQENPYLYEMIIAKAYSIKGIRRLNYFFKQQRREHFNKSQKVSNDYYAISQDFISKIERKANHNIDFLLQKFGITRERYESGI